MIVTGRFFFTYIIKNLSIKEQNKKRKEMAPSNSTGIAMIYLRIVVSMDSSRSIRKPMYAKSVIISYD
jgi:hypothetical protein